MTKEKNTNSKLGFTLLELLVVVLIIGILAAIALPQYQLARDKAEFAKYQSMVASLKDAYDEYVMINGQGTKDFDDLSFTLPSDFVISRDDLSSYQCRSNDSMFCCISKYVSETYAQIVCGKNNLSVMYEYSLFKHTGNIANRLGYCKAEIDNKRTNRLCQSLGTKEGKTNTMTPNGYKNYQKYVLN